MSADETPADRGGGVLAGLLAPLRLPERALEALDSLAEAGRELGLMRSELTRVREQTEPLAELVPVAGHISEQAEQILAVAERISEQAQPLAEMLPALERLEQALGTRVDSLREVVASLESEESYLNKRIEEVLKEVTAMHKTVSNLEDDVERITDRLPEAGEKRGALETARDVLTGSGD
jgi:chromosome segregation ATPase